MKEVIAGYSHSSDGTKISSTLFTYNFLCAILTIIIHLIWCVIGYRLAISPSESIVFPFVNYTGLIS